MNPKRKALIKRLLREAGEDARGAEGSGLSQDDINSIQQDLSDVVEKWLKDNLRPKLPDGAKWGMAIAVGRRERSLIGNNPSVDFIGANFSGFLRDEGGINQGKLKKDLRKHIKKILKNNRGEVKDASGRAFDYRDLKWDMSGRNRLVLPLPVSGGKPREIITDNETNRTIPVNPNRNRKKDKEQGGSGGPRPPRPTPRRRRGGGAKENKCVRDLQQYMSDAGHGRGIDNNKKPYDQQEVDGKWGPRTRQAFYTLIYETNKLIGPHAWAYQMPDGGYPDGITYYSAGYQDFPCLVLAGRPDDDEEFSKLLAYGRDDYNAYGENELEDLVEKFKENVINPDRDYWKEILKDVYGYSPNFEGLCELVEKCRNYDVEDEFEEEEVEEEEEGGGGGPPPPGPTPPRPTPVTPTPGPTTPTTGSFTPANPGEACELEEVTMTRNEFERKFTTAGSTGQGAETGNVNLYNALRGKGGTFGPCGLPVRKVYTWNQANSDWKFNGKFEAYAAGTYFGMAPVSSDRVKVDDNAVKAKYSITRHSGGPATHGYESMVRYTSLYYDVENNDLYVDGVTDNFIIEDVFLFKNKSGQHFLRAKIGGQINESQIKKQKLIKEFKKYLRMV